mgnify:CR=1 FL=1
MSMSKDAALGGTMKVRQSKNLKEQIEHPPSKSSDSADFERDVDPKN